MDVAERGNCTTHDTNYSIHSFRYAEEKRAFVVYNYEHDDDHFHSFTTTKDFVNQSERSD